jgi:hypothetical protein
MYASAVVTRNIERVVERSRKSPRPIKLPVYHTRPESERMVTHFKELYDDETGNWTRQLSPAEIEFIDNERFVCRYDYTYWATRYAWIKDRTDRPVRYVPWVSQVIIGDICAENELEGIGIELQSLKARQLGVSREISLRQLHRLLFHGHINAIMGSSTPDKTGKLADMMEFTISFQPHWLMPNFTGGPRDAAKKSGGEWFEFDTGSSVTLQAGSQVSGIARGTTPTVIHLSELCEFEYSGLGPEELIDSSLFRAVHPDARVFMVLESTALGMNNWWHKKWLTSKSGWPNRRSRLRPVFLPWFVGSAKLGYVYPEKGFLDRSPVPSDYTPVPWAEQHARAAEAYVQSNDLLRKYMGSNWTMPIEQIWFYEVERQQAQNENRLNKFFQEMPSSDDEAFQSTNISIFKTETIVVHRDHAKSRVPKGVYGLVCEDMPSRTILFGPSQIDTTKDIVTVDYEWGQNPRTYQLVPLKWNGYSTDDGLDKIYIYEWPEPGQIYGVGGDTSDGIGKDRSVLEVLRKGSPWQVAGQCAEFASDRLNALDLIPYAMALSALYSVNTGDPFGRSTDAFRKQCRTAIECKGKGDLTQLGMRMDGWTNFHPWIRPDNKKLDISQYNKIGVFTNEWFRQSIQEYLTKMLRDLEIELCSPFLVSEMQSLESDSVSQSFKTAYGGHDDRIMALGFIIISLYQWEPNRPQAAMKPTDQYQAQLKREGKKQAVPRTYLKYTPSQQERMGTIDE